VCECARKISEELASRGEERRSGGAGRKDSEMAGGFAGGGAAPGRAELYEGRITGYFILACIVGSFGGSLFGYDLGVSSQYFFLPNSGLFLH
jgi:hypothetical protein